MSLSRRHFFRNLGLGSAGLLSTPFIIGRGHEAMAFEAGALQPPDDGGFIRISSNENARGPGKKTMDALRNSDHPAGRTRISAGLYGRSRRARLPSIYGVGRDHVIVGTGSGPILEAATRAFCSAQKPLVTAAPTYGTARPGGAPHRRSGQDDYRRQIAGTRYRRDGRGGQGRRDDLLLQPEQPDRHGAQRGRRREIRPPRQAELAGDANPDRRGVHRLHARRRRQDGGAAGEGTTPASSSPDRSRRRTGWPACVSATPSANPRHSRRFPVPGTSAASTR